MDRVARRSALAGFLTLALLPPAAAAPPDPEPGDVILGEVDVRLVEVEVFVTDREGRPVTGLARDDFELLHDGEPVEISHFGTLTAGRWDAGRRLAEAETAAPAPAPRRSADRLHLVVYVDHRYLEPGDLRDALDDLAKFLLAELDPRDRVMLATAGRGLEVRQGFTSVPELVTVHFPDLGAAPGGGRVVNDYRDLLESIQRTRLTTVDQPAVNPQAGPRALLTQIEAFAAEVADEVGRTAGRLEQLVRQVAGLSGRKVVLYVGGRVPTEAGRALYEAWRGAFGSQSQLSVPSQPTSAGSVDPNDLGGDVFGGPAAALADLDAERPLRDVAAVANAGGVTLHTLDVGGLRLSGSFLSSPTDPNFHLRTSGESGTPQLEAERAITGRRALGELAAATGGHSLAGSRDFAAALEVIGRDLDTFYSLGFQPPPEAAGEAHRLAVRLRGRSGELTVRHRRSYVLKSRDQESAERTLAALYFDGAENPLEVELAAGEPRPAGDGLRLPVAVTVPLARLALVADGRAHAGRLSIFFTAGSFRDGAAPVTKAVVPVRIANEELLTALGRRVEFKTELDLDGRAGRLGKTGPERVAVTVRDDFRAASATVVAPLAPR